MIIDLLSAVLGNSIKLYALMTPPAVLSAFLGYTRHYTRAEKRKVALKTPLAIFLLGSALYLWGANIFELFGFTLDAFRIGSGVLLMLTAIALMRDDGETEHEHIEGDISIVPLAIPLGMGPASIGAVMVMGAQATTTEKTLIGVFSLFLAALAMFLLLRIADMAGRILGATGIAVLAKLTGLILAAIAAQVIFTGIKGFLN
ncbi:MAG: MarC family protein [Desulfovibrio sp.]|nr:MarC family protein [Desulfovibrio sp.]